MVARGCKGIMSLILLMDNQDDYDVVLVLRGWTLASKAETLSLDGILSIVTFTPVLPLFLLPLF